MQQLSQSAMVQHLQAARFDQVSAAMPKNAREVVAGNHPPVSQLAKVVGMERLTGQIEFELVKITQLVSVGGSLNDAQIQFCAEQLLEVFPNETLADFKIAFQRGCIGSYGDIYRLDAIVIRGWVTKYLEEKYEEVEKQARKFKEAERQKPDEKTLSPVALESLEKMRANLGDNTKKSVGMTDAEIRRNGQEKPPKRDAVTAGYAWFNVLGIKVLAADRKHAKQQIRKNIENGMLEFGMSRGKNRTK